MASIPQIPDIQTQQAPSVVDPNTLTQMLGQISQVANNPLPPQFNRGTQIAEPNVKSIVPYQNKETQNRPIAPYVADVKRARRQNSVAGLANIIGQAGQKLQENKQNLLKDDLKTVMNAKTNIANAEQVLQQDPNNKMAKGVLEANKKALDAILSDPKKQKQLSKALDISFVDPEKNKTPEVQAYQKAQAEVKAQGAFNSNNPAEHAVAQAAQTNELGDKLPAQQPSAQANPAQPKSATPYADQALAKDLPTVQVNPQYDAALKQQQLAQKQVAAILPKLIEAESKATLQAAKDGQANARAIYTQAANYFREQAKYTAALNLQDQKAKDNLAAIARKNAGELARTREEIASREKIAAAHEKNVAVKNELAKNGGVQGLLDTKIKKATDTIAVNDKVLADIVADTTLKGQAKQDAIEAAQAQRGMNAQYLTALEQMRQEKLGIKAPPPANSVPKESSGGFFSSLFDGLGKYSSITMTKEQQKEMENKAVQQLGGKPNGTSEPTIKPVGESESDEPDDDDPDDDSDKYGSN
jgi:hypothetical protein